VDISQLVLFTFKNRASLLKDPLYALLYMYLNFIYNIYIYVYVLRFSNIYNIFVTFMGTFYIKIMRLRVSSVSRFILEMPTVRELCSHFIRARNSLILSCSSGRSFYITLLVGVMERGEEENVEGKERSGRNC